MTAADSTKRMFADALEQMLRATSMDKVRVSGLCRICNTTPQVFYYHFKDKYDLAAWMYIRDFTGVFGPDDKALTQEKTKAFLSTFADKKSFYRKVLTDWSQNSLFTYIFESYLKIGKLCVQRLTGLDLTVQQQLEIRANAYMSLNMQRDWILGKLENVTGEELTEFLHRHTSPLLLEAFSKAEYNQDDVFA